MRNQMRLHGTIGQVYQMKPRCTRGKGEVYDAHHVLMNDAPAMAIQRIERAPQQARVYLPVDNRRPPEREFGSCGPRSNRGNGKIDKKATRKYQDGELQRK
jgi:hypothetical protein